MDVSVMNIGVRKIHKLNNTKNLRAFVDIVVNDALLIRGFRVVNGRNGIFVSMPQEQAKDKKWYETVSCLDQSIQKRLSKEILKAFQES